MPSFPGASVLGLRSWQLSVLLQQLQTDSIYTIHANVGLGSGGFKKQQVLADFIGVASPTTVVWLPEE